MLGGRESRPEAVQSMVAVGLSVAHSRAAVSPSLTTTLCGETRSRGGEGEAGEAAGGGRGEGGGGGCHTVWW